MYWIKVNMNKVNTITGEENLTSHLVGEIIEKTRKKFM